MKWIKCAWRVKGGKWDFTVPKESGDYWVTDGYYVEMAHYDSVLDEWGIYQPDKNGVIRRCIRLDDMNFSITAYAEMEYPKHKERFALE